MRPAIVRVLTRLGAGGPPIHATLLNRELCKLGYDSVLVTGRCDAADGDMAYLLQPADAVHLVEEMSRAVSPWRDLVALVKLCRFLRAKRPDIVHTHTAKAGVLGRIAARLAGTPVVVHTFHGNVLEGYFSAPVNRLVRWIERALASGTDAICTLSPQQASEIRDRFRIAPGHKVHVIPLGMDLRPFQKLDPPETTGSRLVVGWLGRFVPIKDVSLLCAIVRETCRRSNRVQFLIAGDGPERHRVVSAAQDLGPSCCEYLGWQQDVAPVLRRCHVLIQTSRNEGTPVALIQGMAAGRPFVSTAAGGVVDMAAGPLLRETEGCRWYETGVLAQARASAFAGALCELAASPGLAASMGARSAEFASRNFTLETLLTRLDGLYRGLLASRQGDSLARLARTSGDIASPEADALRASPEAPRTVH